MFWRQKSREKWLRLGDRNSKFFHNSVKANRSRNYLIKLNDKNGIAQWSDAVKAEVAIEYFTGLFSSSNPPSYESVFQSMIPKVTPSMNKSLVDPITKEEVRDAVFSIEAESAPGPDGMTATFFQRFWHTIGDSVTSEIQEVLRNGSLPVDWNFTYLCLIPKIPNPENMVDLRPISLCSVLYKTVSKILVKRLQPFLGELVSVNQSAFVSQRLIQDNILIAHEAVHALQTHPGVAMDYIAVKTDMSKAYDRIEWCYLRSLMEAMGFDKQWIRWIMMCVSSASFAVLINDQPYGLITPTRGLRQGDPLSPFLFVLCTEGLSHLLNVVERNNLLQGMSFTEEGPAIHHLFFADDSLFLCKATASQCKNLQRCLKIYGEAAGQCINLQKSSITFGKLIPENKKQEIKDIFGIYNEGGSSKYLGLPECFSGSKVELLSYLKDRTHCRLESWFLRSLSQGGKEIMLKTTAAALPVFAMSCFKVPKTVIKALNSSIANYWWSSKSHLRKIHWIAWDVLCLPKALGGMGFKDLECFNQALLAKQAWKLINQPESLLAKFIKSRYHPKVDFLSAVVGSRPSFAWRSLLYGRELLIKGLKWQVGNGENTRVWIDKWVDDPNLGMRAPWIKNISFDVNLTTNKLINFSIGKWDVHALKEIFVPGDVDLIISKQPVTSRADSHTWKYNKSGNLTVKSAYWLAQSSKIQGSHPEVLIMPSIIPLKAKIWKVPTVPKIRTFMWKILGDALPVADLLINRGMKVDERCQMCGLDGESLHHIFFQCDAARQVWALSGIPQPEFCFHGGSVFSNLAYLLKLKEVSRGDPEDKRSWPWVLWYIWKSRNEFLFQGKVWLPEETQRKAKEESDEWFLAQVVETELVLKASVTAAIPKRQWNPPSEGWLMCNVAFDWNREGSGLGVAWVLRNHRGVVTLHSRRAYSSVRSLEEARNIAILWAIESMASMHISKVVFAGDFRDLFAAVKKPFEWPTLSHQVKELLGKLNDIAEYQLRKVMAVENRGAAFIAQSVRQGRSQSYVAAGPLAWLFELFVNESRFL